MRTFYRPLSEKDVKDHTNAEGRLVFRFQIGLYELACSSDDGTIEGLNQIVDELMPGGVIIGDINYRPVHVDGDLIVTEVDADVTNVDNQEDK